MANSGNSGEVSEVTFCVGAPYDGGMLTAGEAAPRQRCGANRSNTLLM